MPSLTHEGLLCLFRNRPELAPELLRDALHVSLPAYAEARVESAELTDIVPTEYRADLVVLLVEGKPVLGIIVEVQLELKDDDRKFFTWPVYVANLRARLECPTCVLVVTPSEAVATRAQRSIVLGPGSSVTPFVVGPSAVPLVSDIDEAKRDPELAVLSAMAHGDDAPAIALPIVTAALAAAAGLDSERALLYSDLIRISLGEAARRAFEEIMTTGNYEFQSEFHKKADAAGRAKAVLVVLEARALPVSPEQRERILTCTDRAVVDSWLRKVATSASADDLFTD